LSLGQSRRLLASFDLESGSRDQENAMTRESERCDINLSLSGVYLEKDSSSL